MDAAAPAKAAPPPAAPVPVAWKHPLDAPPARAAHGMVATDAEHATKVGVDVLRDGGNAVDAAVATAFALAVVLPEAGNLGGGGFLVVRTAAGKAEALDFRETAPAAATRDMFLGPDGKATDRSLVGALAAGVPGSVAGLWEVHRRHGRMKWDQLVAPAVKLAEGGFVVSPAFAANVARYADVLARFPASAALLLPGGKPPEVGATLKNADLGLVLRRIADKGPAGFYQGETAGLVVAEMKRSGGIVTRADLAGYKAVWRAPIAFEYRGLQVFSMPPPSSGGIVLALCARMLDKYDLAAMPWHSVDELHLLAEAMRRGFAARNQFLGDPDFVQVPLQAFLSAEYAERQRASISLERATPSKLIDPAAGMAAARPEPAHTTHFSVVDGEGGAVALTTTLNTSYGSGVTVTGAGFLLNNEMDDFAVAPGQPNVYGLVQGESNAIAPGKRMLSSMSPTLVVGKDGHVLLVTGASGGPTIISTVLQIVVNVVDYRMDVARAVAAPRVHHQHLPDRVAHETDGLTDEQRQGLAARGHEVKPHPWGTMGDAPSILWTGAEWTGSAEPRKAGGLATGY